MRSVTIVCALAVLVSCGSAGAGTAASASPAPAGAASGSCPPQTSEFAFWVGDWTLSVVDPLGTGAATNTVTREGCRILEHYQGYFRGKPAYEATSANEWNVALGKWQQRYVDPSGVGWYTGTFANGTMTLYAGTQGGAVANTNRVLWTNITAGGFDWIWQRSRDNGATWDQELSRIRYTRKG